MSCKSGVVEMLFGKIWKNVKGKGCCTSWVTNLKHWIFFHLGQTIAALQPLQQCCDIDMTQKGGAVMKETPVLTETQKRTRKTTVTSKLS
jgi:hypothetical protein